VFSPGYKIVILINFNIVNETALRKKHRLICNELASQAIYLC